MATYKVLQDIEAEDKLIGPLTLRQCIYAAIAIIAGYMSYLAMAKQATFLVIFFLPFIAFGLFFAFPWTKQQSTEVWALAKIRFILKPRKRIWNQSGAKELVTVTVPKAVEDPRAHALSETEVRSRLRALADTIDSRGWAIKNVPLDMYTGHVTQPTSDRLVQASSMPMEVTNYSTTASDDMFDMANNPIAQQFDAKITAASTARRQQLEQVLDNPQAAYAATAQTMPGNPQAAWYLPQPAASSATAPPPTVPLQPGVGVPQAANPTAEDMAVIAEIKRKQELLDSQAAHWHMVQPLSAQDAAAPAALGDALAPAGIAPYSTLEPATPLQPAVPQNPPAPVTAAPNPAILELANNNDLNVATIAREAHHINPDTPDEVVVSLH